MMYYTISIFEFDNVRLRNQPSQLIKVKDNFCVYINLYRMLVSNFPYSHNNHKQKHLLPTSVQTCINFAFF